MCKLSFQIEKDSFVVKKLQLKTICKYFADFLCQIIYNRKCIFAFGMYFQAKNEIN